MQLRREAATRAAERARRLEELSRGAEAERIRLAGREGIADANSYPLTIVPSFSRKVGELPAERTERFRENLREVIRNVLDEPLARSPVPQQPDTDAPPAGEPTPVQNLLASACGLCRGKCCQHGGDHAYLSEDTIRRFRERHPDAHPEEVTAAYLEHIPQRTFDDSCLFHGERGCSLPRDMRSATCNNFLCDQLQELRQRLDAGASPRAFFVSVENLDIIAMKFVDAGPQE